MVGAIFLQQINVAAADQYPKAGDCHAYSNDGAANYLSHLRSSIWSLKSHRGRIPQAISIMAQATAPINAPTGLGTSSEAQYTKTAGSIKPCRTENIGRPRWPWSPFCSGGPNL